MSTSAAVWSTQVSNETSGVASALVSVMTALLAFRGADGRAQDGTSVLEKIALLEQTASDFERRADECDKIDVSSFEESLRAELCAARDLLVVSVALMDGLLSAMTGLRHLVDTRPDVLPPEIAHRLLSALSLMTTAVERSIASWHPKLDVATYPRYLPSFDEHMATLWYWRDEVFEVGTLDENEHVTPLDLSSATQVQAWLTDLQEQIDDAVSAGEDATRPPSRRALGRSMARAKVLEARVSLRSLLVAAQRGLVRQP